MSLVPERLRRAGAPAAGGAFIGAALLLAAAIWYVVQRGRTTRFLRGETGAAWATHFAATRLLTTLTVIVLIGASALMLRAQRSRPLPAALLIVSAALAISALQVSPAHFGNALSPGLVSRYPNKYGIAALLALVASAAGVFAGAIQISQRESVPAPRSVGH